MSLRPSRHLSARFKIEIMAKRKSKDKTKEKINRANLILEAAEALLGEVGYDGVSMRDVAQRAGVNKALIFYYFSSKAELFERVLERYYTAHREALTPAFAVQGDLKTRFHHVLDVYIDYISENIRYPRLIQSMVARGHTDQITQIQRQLRPFFEWISRALEEIVTPDGPLAARQFFVSISGMVMNYFTYAPVLGTLWEGDALSPKAIEERRQHLHWIADVVIVRLLEEKALYGKAAGQSAFDLDADRGPAP